MRTSCNIAVHSPDVLFIFCPFQVLLLQRCQRCGLRCRLLIFFLLHFLLLRFFLTSSCPPLSLPSSSPPLFTSFLPFHFSVSLLPLLHCHSFSASYFSVSHFSSPPLSTSSLSCTSSLSLSFFSVSQFFLSSTVNFFLPFLGSFWPAPWGVA